MNVSIWDVNDQIQALIRAGHAADTSRLADPDVPWTPSATVISQS